MKQTPKSPTSDRQQNADIPHRSFGAIRIPAVAGATALKSTKAKPKEQPRDLPPLLRKDQFYD